MSAFEPGTKHALLAAMMLELRMTSKRIETCVPLSSSAVAFQGLK